MTLLVFKGKKKVSVCPECGGEEFGVIVYFSGQSEYNRLLENGCAGENSQLHDGVNYRELKSAFCSDCETPLGRVQEIDD